LENPELSDKDVDANNGLIVARFKVRQLMRALPLAPTYATVKVSDGLTLVSMLMFHCEV